VRAVHPDLTDKPVHGTFAVNKLAVTPTRVNLNISKNYEQTIRIRAQAAEGTTATNLRIVFDDENAPAGVHVTVGDPVAELAGGKSATLPIRLCAALLPEKIVFQAEVFSEQLPYFG